MEPILNVKNLTMKFGGLTALDSVDISIKKGEIAALIGPNGAGKTTLVKQIIGLLKPTSGELTLGPYDLIEDPDAGPAISDLGFYDPVPGTPVGAYASPVLDGGERIAADELDAGCCSEKYTHCSTGMGRLHHGKQTGASAGRR